MAIENSHPACEQCGKTGCIESACEVYGCCGLPAMVRVEETGGDWVHTGCSDAWRGDDLETTASIPEERIAEIAPAALRGRIAVVRDPVFDDDELTRPVPGARRLRRSEKWHLVAVALFVIASMLGCGL